MSLTFAALLEVSRAVAFASFAPLDLEGLASPAQVAQRAEDLWQQTYSRALSEVRNSEHAWSLFSEFALRVLVASGASGRGSRVRGPSVLPLGSPDCYCGSDAAVTFLRRFHRSQTLLPSLDLTPGVWLLFVRGLRCPGHDSVPLGAAPPLCATLRQGFLSAPSGRCPCPAVVTLCQGHLRGP